jgi:phosphatidate phosphatase LPIN
MAIRSLPALHFTFDLGNGRSYDQETRRSVLSLHSLLNTNRRATPQVNVSVNDHPIPFNMKIGEAGEAFFVFETDDEVPADLITSPLLQPTRPGPTGIGVPEDNLDARQGPDGSEHIQPGEGDPTYTENGELRKREPETQEPEFLDLDALPSPPQEEDEAFKNVDTTPKPPDRPPFSTKPSQASILQPMRPVQILPSPPLTPPHTHSMPNAEEMLVQDKRVDEAINAAKDTFFLPDVEYHHGQWHKLPSIYKLTV